MFQPCNNDSCNIATSVLIVFRNERKHIPALLDKLKEQTHNNFEVIFIDDHSTDGTADYIKENSSNLTCKVATAIGKGKKNGIKEGISLCNGDFILCTDADCLPESKDWIKTVATFQLKMNCDLLICPVTMKSSNSTFEQLQALEFQSLVASGAGSAIDRKPFLCNGANLAFKRTAYDAKALHEEELSGDDVFLLQSIKQKGGKIRFLKSKEAIVLTSPCTSISAFMNQRSRWAGKSKSYTDSYAIIIALLIFLLCCTLAVSIIKSCCGTFPWWIMLIALAVKLKADASLLFATKEILSHDSIAIKNILLLSLLYPFYVIIAAVKGLLGLYEWKGRR